MDLSKATKIVLITGSSVILTFVAGYASLQLFRMDDPNASISEEKANIPDLNGVGAEVVYTNCDTLAKDEAISIYFWRSAVKNDQKALVFRYDPGRHDNPLPSITHLSPSTILISVPEVSSIAYQSRKWQGISVGYRIGKVQYPATTK